MNEQEKDKLEDILVELTDSYGYTGTQEQVKAFKLAFERISNMINDIDSAERC